MLSSEVVSTIIQSRYTIDELSSIMEAVKFARDRLGKQNSFIMRKGAKVQFTSTKTGSLIEGTVEKVNPKNIIVKTGQFQTWRVPASMLTLIG